MIWTIALRQVCVRLLCHQTLSKRGNLERHHNPKFKDIFPPKSASPAKRVVELKSGLKAQQSLFGKPVNLHKAATKA